MRKLKYPANWLLHLGFALLVLALSLGTTYWLWVFETRNAEQEQRARNDAAVETFASQLEQRMRTQELVLRGVQALFSATDYPVDRDGLARYVDTLQLNADTVGLEGLGWAPLVPLGRKAEHVVQMRQQGFLAYTIRPDVVDAVSAPLVQMEPAAEPDTYLLGTDLLADPERRAAMERARDTGVASITVKLTRLVEVDANMPAGFVMFLPVYHNGAPTNTLAARRANLRGWIVAPCRMDVWMAALPGAQSNGVDIHLFDGIVLTAQSLLFASDPGAAAVPRPGASLEYLQVAGRTWTLAAEPRAGVLGPRSQDKVKIIVRNGVVLSVLLSLFAWVLISDRARTMIVATRMTTELREAKEHFELIFNNCPDGMLITQQTDGRIVDVNDGFTAMTGYGRDDVVSRSINALPFWKSPDDRRRYRRALEEQQACENLEVGLLHKDGHDMVVILSAQSATFKGVACFVGVLRDITGRKAIEDRMSHMARHDMLTGLPNRTLFDDRLKQAMAHAYRDHERVGLLYVDLDHFKPVNDTWGHAAGDVLLQAVAQRMQDCVRASDTVARVGGDEFVVLLPTVHDAADALAVAEKIRSALSKSFWLAQGQMVNISSSIGVAIYPEHGEDEIQLSKSADVAMYQSKQMGRDQVSLFKASDTAPLDI